MASASAITTVAANDDSGDPSVGAAPSATHRRRRGEHLASFAYLIPALVVFAAFFFVPLGRSIYLSFQRSDIFGRPNGFVGLRNYGRLFTDPEFGEILLITLLFVIMTVVPSMLIGLLLALLLQAKIRLVRFSAPPSRCRSRSRWPRLPSSSA